MRGCDNLFCHDDVCRSYISKSFHAASMKVECLSAAITQRNTEADGPHVKGDGPESAYGMVSLVQSATVDARHTPHDRHGEQRHTNPQGQSSGTAPTIPFPSPRHILHSIVNIGNASSRACTLGLLLNNLQGFCRLASRSVDALKRCLYPNT